LKENSHLQEQLLQETKPLKIQVRELKKQKATREHHIACAEEVLYDKDHHIWSLTSPLAKMREWAAVLGEGLTVDSDLKLEMSGSGNVAHLEIQRKSALEKLVYGAI
jgi:hypothetical protein